MTKTQIAEILSKGIEKYTGEDVLTLKFVQDPVVDNTWAMRAQVKNIGEMDCLAILGDRPFTIDNVDLCLEECTFKSWPPTTR